MKSKVMCTLVLLASCWASHVLADGNDLLKQCQDGVKFVEGVKVESLVGAGQCLGTVKATIDTLEIARQLYGSAVGKEIPSGICWPEQAVPTIQGMRIVVKYLKDHPEDLHMGASTLVTMAVLTAFPCYKQPSK